MLVESDTPAVSVVVAVPEPSEPVGELAEVEAVAGTEDESVLAVAETVAVSVELVVLTPAVVDDESTSTVAVEADGGGVSNAAAAPA